ncbi:MAG TPA: hypothetical protein VI704_00005, partial [Bacteroidota bacterium]|nr:hypothetical protein [Bacteroidota bacterium]
MIRRLLIPCVLGILLTSNAPSQQNLYVQPMNSVESFSKAPVLRGAVSATGQVALASTDRIVKVYEGGTLTERLSITGVTNRVAALSFTESGQTIVTATSDGVLSLWNAKTGALERSFTGFSNVISLGALSENLVFILGLERTVKVHDAVSGKSIGSASSKDELTAFALHPNGKIFAVGSVTGEVRIYAIAQMAVTNVLPDAKEKITTLA